MTIVTARNRKTIAKARAEADQRAFAEALRKRDAREATDHDCDPDLTAAYAAWIAAMLKERNVP